MNDDELSDERLARRTVMVRLAHTTPAAFVAIRAAHHMGIDWRHVDALTNLLWSREGRSLDEPPQEDDVFNDCNDCATVIRRACQSPIEELFVATFCTIEWTKEPRFNRMLLDVWTEKIFEWSVNDKVVAKLYQQYSVATYRADFVLHGPQKQVVIELDGHDFHERTREQAARDKSRDRAMVEAGYAVLRFTGSELWKNPVGCAEQVARVGGLL